MLMLELKSFEWVVNGTIEFGQKHLNNTSHHLNAAESGIDKDSTVDRTMEFKSHYNYESFDGILMMIMCLLTYCSYIVIMSSISHILRSEWTFWKMI